MSNRSLVATCAAVGAALGAGIWLLLPAAGTGFLSTPTETLGVRASFTPAAAEFGDAVTAHIEVIADRSGVRTGTVRIVYSLAPLTQLGPPRERRVTRGGVTVISTTLRAACLSDRCISTTRRVVPPLSPVRADAMRRDGTHAQASAAWGTLEIGGRVGSSDAAASRPPFRVDTTPPPVTYRIPPPRLALLLDVAAVILVGAGFALAGAALLQRGSRRPAADRIDALDEALALARAARARPAPDRRSALGLIARLLQPRDRRLARSADDLAWSRRAPTPERLTDLLDDVEREVRR